MLPHEAPVTDDALVPREALTAAVSELDVIRVQLKEALVHDRSARFYDLLRLRTIGRDHAEVIGTVIELSEGHAGVHWPREGGMGWFPSSVSMRSGLHVGHEALLSLVEVSERRAPSEPGAATPTLHDRLTNRDRQLLMGLSQGLSNSQIAFRVGLSISTVKNRLTLLFQELGVQSRTQAALVAHDLDLTSTPAGTRDG